jgi:ribosome biogenesis GTPase / thiamine phosphate phosphatase
MSLSQLGWSSHFADRFEPWRAEGLSPGRVVLLQRGLYRLTTDDGEIEAVVPGSLRHEADADALPAIGDWVAFRPPDAPGTPARIEHVLPRRTKLSRASAGRRRQEQVVAANVDTVFVVMGLDGDFNLRRLERFLSMVWESGAQPVVLLNKRDLVPPERLPDFHREADEVSPGADVVMLAAKSGKGTDDLAPYLRPGQTIALVGSSGAGKSTLINHLLGHEHLATAAVREGDDRGQHTTTHRELVRLPCGTLLIDNPGIRELQLWNAREGVAESFEDVEEVAARCRFRDCRHENEPGCAVRRAVDDGDLPESRLASYQGLRKELDYQELRQSETAQQTQKRKWKAIHSEMKRFKKERDA